LVLGKGLTFFDFGGWWELEGGRFFNIDILASGLLEYLCRLLLSFCSHSHDTSQFPKCKEEVSVFKLFFIIENWTDHWSRTGLQEKSERNSRTKSNVWTSLVWLSMPSIHAVAQVIITKNANGMILGVYNFMQKSLISSKFARRYVKCWCLVPNYRD
jgi:hypothetical protein